MELAESRRTIVDSVIERMVADGYSDALDLLAQHRDELDHLRKRLVHSRELERIDILAALGGGRLPESSSAVGT